MSAIFGMFHRDQRPIDPQYLQRMQATLAHRGQDGTQLWHTGAIGLGHRLLWTTPESLLEILPLTNPTGDRIITADARIDNREELIAALNLAHHSAEKITDSQLILAAYEAWGEQCVDRLLGDFAFAIWDEPAQTLFCARDHFGVKPFYYYCSEQTFGFASEIKALFCLPDVPRHLNEVRISDYLTSMFHDTCSTSYRAILRLPSAHRLMVSPTDVRLDCYWQLDPTRKLQLGSDAEYIEAFQTILTEAVRCRLRSAFPIGSTLSGGLDSSSVTCTARKLLAEQGKQSLQTFSLIYDDLPECDERQFIQPMLDQGGLEAHFIPVDRLKPLDHLEQQFWYQDEAPYAPNGYTSWALHKAMQQQGIRVVLSGFDGDNTVSYGYGYLTELAQAGRWFKLIQEIRDLSKSVNISTHQWIWSYVNQFGLKPAIAKSPVLRLGRRMWQWSNRIWRSEPTSQPAMPAWSSLLQPQFIQQVGLTERHKAWRRTQAHPTQTEREQHYRNVATQGMSAFALEMMDKVAAACSTEMRYPLWDKRLVEFCLALPAEQKLYRGFNRAILRHAMTGTLPPEVQWRRSKTDFSSGLVQGLLAEQPRLEDFIQHQLYELDQYVNRDTVQAVYQRFITNQSTNPAQDARTLWLVVSLGQWLHYRSQNQPTLLPTEVVSV